MQIKDIHHKFLMCNSVSIDTRNIRQNSFFIAIKGENFDANTFTKEALEKGATYVLIDNQEYYIDNRTILVENTLHTLQQLANFHRNYLQLPIIALTGSNGKTTTKELIAAVLSQKFNTKATLGNLNNHLGVPLTLLSFDKSTEIGIVEMGANHQKEIELLCQIAEPNFGYITNFGKAHLEGFGGFEGVIKGKSELYDYLRKNDKIAFINTDDHCQITNSQGIEKITFAMSNTNVNTTFSQPAANPFAAVNIGNTSIQSNLIGIYNINNICAAITIGKYFGVTIEEAKTAIENYHPTNNRSQIINKNSNQIVLDAYNANPSSMKAALENFKEIKHDHKILILGDMFELGTESDIEHQNIISQASILQDVEVYFVGKHFYANKKAKSGTYFFESYTDFENHIKSKTNFNNALILIKGSRGMALERILDFI